jgi:hypothetical protein
LNHPEKEARQRIAAKEVLCLRDELELLIMNCQTSDADPTALRKSLEHLTRELDRAYKFVPNTSPETNIETGRRLHAGEMTFTDEEMNASCRPASARSRRRSYTSRVAAQNSLPQRFPLPFGI